MLWEDMSRTTEEQQAMLEKIGFSFNGGFVSGDIPEEV